MYLEETWQCDLELYKLFNNDKWSVKLQCNNVILGSLQKSISTEPEELFHQRRPVLWAGFPMNKGHNSHQGIMLQSLP